MGKARRRREKDRVRTLSRRDRSAKNFGPDQRVGESPHRLFAFTIDPKTAEIVKLESLAPGGKRHELSDQEKVKLARTADGGRIEDVVEQVFEAGIAYVLGDGDTDGAEESEEEAQLRHLLLTPMIERSAARRLIRREVLGRVIFGTLIRNSIRSAEPSSPSKGAAAPNQ